MTALTRGSVRSEIRVRGLTGAAPVGAGGDTWQVDLVVGGAAGERQCVRPTITIPMNEGKQGRIARAQQEANARRRKAIRSLAHCLGRSDVMRLHHDDLVNEMLEAGGQEHFTSVKKLRFEAYVCFWFAGLATVVERYQQLVNSGTIPNSEEVSKLLTSEFIDLLKPFRNAVAHCSDHDDARVLQLLSEPHTIPDHAATVAHAFQRYFQQQEPSAYEGANAS